MPFKSEQQRKWMHANKPELAKKWEKKLAYSDRKETEESMFNEGAVRISSHTDIEFHGGIARLIGKKGSIPFDKKSFRKLVQLVNQHIGRSFTMEDKINEAKVVTLPNNIKVKLSFKGVEFKGAKGTVSLDRAELMTFFKAARKNRMYEGKLTEGFKKIAKKNVKYKDKWGTWNWEIESGIDTDVMGGNTPKIILHYQLIEDDGFPSSGGNTFWLKHKNGKPFTPQEAKKLVNKISNKKIHDFQRKSTNPSGTGQNIYYVDGKFIREGFAGGLPKGKRKAFDNARQKQSEVLGYKLMGIKDIKTEIDDATITEGLQLMSEVADDKELARRFKSYISKSKGNSSSMADAFGQLAVYFKGIGYSNTFKEILKAMKMKFTTEGTLKVLKTINEKACKQGEKAATTGCTPASGGKKKGKDKKKEKGDDAGGPSYANVPKGAKSTKQAKLMKKNDSAAKDLGYKDTKDLAMDGTADELGELLDSIPDEGQNFNEADEMINYIRDNELGERDDDDDVVEGYRKAFLSMINKPGKKGGSGKSGKDIEKQSMKAADDANTKMDKAELDSEMKAFEKRKKEINSIDYHPIRNPDKKLKKKRDDLMKKQRDHYIKVIKPLEKKVYGESIEETKKRDYKKEYKKFQSSTKAKKYRAELNKYNRQKGTYGNGDGKDASHKGGKIVGFEAESKNRGRREKSRLKKESITISKKRIREIIREELIKEGTCGYGKNGKLGKKPAGPHLIKKKKIKESRIAKTILQQLGGNKFIAMTGAKNFGSSRNSLQMKIGRNSKSISHVIITLKSSDLYEMEFIRIRGVKRTVVKKVKGVYADQLGTMFKKYTGMNVRL